jgi:hypothetical protein
MLVPVCRRPTQNNYFRLKCIYTVLLTIILTSISSPQIPVNGFCRYVSHRIDTGFNSLYAVNYNNDSYTDLLIFNSQKKQIIDLEGSSSGKFEKQLSYELPFEMTKIVRLADEKNKTIGYAFSSRKGRSAGIFRFSKKGRPEMLRKIKFSSYPENICAADINKDNETELLVSGGSFEGLALLNDSNRTLQQIYIDKKNCYGGATFIDLTNDGVADIAAYNLLSNSLEFFYNDGTGNFRKERSFSFSEKIHSFKVFDLNLDSYQDLMFISGGTVCIMYGDFRSSYERKILLQTKYTPDSFVIGDYNRDGRIDLAYLNSDKSIVSALFAKDRFNFYEEVVMLHKPGISSLITFYSKFMRGIAVISEKGYIYTISRLSSIADDTEISISAKPSVINYFDNENDGIYDICFIDEFDNSLKIIIRNNAGIPSLFFSYPLFGFHSKIIIDDMIPDMKTFYCYKPGNRLIEKIKIDFLKNKFEREQIYSAGNLLDFKVARHDTGKYNIYILYEKNKTLGFSVFTKINEFSFTEDYKNIAFNVFDAAISDIHNVAFFYWRASEDSLMLTKKMLPKKRRIIDPGESADISQLITSKRINILQPVSRNEDFVTTFIGDIYNKKREVCITFITQNAASADSNKQDITIISSSQTLKIIKNRNLTVTANNQIFFGEMGFNRIKKLFIYEPDEKRLEKLDFIEGGSRLVKTPVADSVNINHYFIKNMSFRNYHLVYTDKESGCISIRKIG